MVLLEFLINFGQFISLAHWPGILISIFHMFKCIISAWARRCSTCGTLVLTLMCAPPAFRRPPFAPDLSAFSECSIIFYNLACFCYSFSYQPTRFARCPCPFMTVPLQAFAGDWCQFSGSTWVSKCYHSNARCRYFHLLCGREHLSLLPWLLRPL